MRDDSLATVGAIGAATLAGVFLAGPSSLRAAPVKVTLKASDGVVLAASYHEPSAAGKEGPALVLMPMLGSSRSAWDEFAARAASSGVAVLTLDPRGHGESANPLDGNAAEWPKRRWEEADRDPAAAVAWLERRGFPPMAIFLGGASIGASLAFRRVARDPRLGGAVLVSPGDNPSRVPVSESVGGYGRRPLFIASAADDPQFDAIAGRLAAAAAGRVTRLRLPAGGHGTSILSHPSSGPALERAAILWLRQESVSRSAREQTSYLVDSFSGGTEADGRPAGWKALFFKSRSRHTIYTVERNSAGAYVKAVSSASASVLLKEVNVDLAAAPILKWRWKIETVLKRADVRRKDADDAAARIYIAFAFEPKRAKAWERLQFAAIRAFYGEYPPQSCVNYIWDNRLPVGTTLDNAHTSRSKMIVVESGAAKAGQWVSEERDVYADYVRLFGTRPPATAFVAIMSDTDDTGESTAACFGDIAFHGPVKGK